MSATVFEARGPNKALFRTAALAGSVIIWSGLGYLALNYVPQMERLIPVEPPAIQTVPVPPKIIDPPKPPIVKQDEVKPPQVALLPDISPTPPIITTRPVDNPRPTNLPRDLTAGAPPATPATGDTGIQAPAAVPLAIPAQIDPPVVIVPPLPEIVSTPPPPMPKLVINPIKASGANPVFPNRPLDAGISGEVTLSFTVTPSGRVEGITILSESPRRYGFAKAAEDAIATWTFQPQTIDGVPVAYPARYTISFKLED